MSSPREGKRKAKDSEPEESRAPPANGLIRTSALFKQMREEAGEESVKISARFIDAFRKDCEERLRQSLKRARLNKRRTLMPADV